MSYYDSLTPEELRRKIENVRNTESFLDLIIERNRMLNRSEINNPVYQALEVEIEKRREQINLRRQNESEQKSRK